ncbi:MAG: hypothetical protein Q9184_001553 [Pyrenodesmia sp. 2 TL-2023]
MPGVEAVLYHVAADGTRYDDCTLHFTSSDNDKNPYYVYEPPEGTDPEHNLVTRISQARSHLAILCEEEDYPYHACSLLIPESDVGRDSIQLEASGPSVWIQACTWKEQLPTTSYMQLSPSTAASQILYIVRPGEAFRIGERDFALQARQARPDQDVQVMSSRPNEVEVELAQENGSASGSQSNRTPETPQLASGPTVLETPVTNRNQHFQQQKARSSSQQASPTPTKLSQMKDRKAESDGRGNDEDTSGGLLKGQQGLASEQSSAGKANPLRNTKESVFAPASVEEDHPLVADANGSSQETASSDCGSSDLNTSRQISPLGPHNTRKRSRSLDIDGELFPAKKTTVELESASYIDEESVPEPTNKRQRRNAGRPSNGMEESQNSMQSTIHVEVPQTAQSLSPAPESYPSPVQADEQLRESLEPDTSAEDVSSTPRSHAKSAEPPSSARSTRSNQPQSGQQSSPNQATRVYFSSSSTVKDSSAYTKFLRQHNVKQVRSIADADVLCSGKGEIKRTANLLLTVLKGNDVVTDQWVIKSAAKKKILDPKGFVPESQARAKEWGTSLADAIARGRRGLKPLEGWTINFTPAAKKELGKSWPELKDLCFAAGAQAVQAMIPKQGPKDTESTVVIAASHEPEQSTLEERDWKMFNKDIVTFSILRGGIDTDSDEFLMDARKTKKGAGRGRKKKA